jgi:hypothetical protein
MPAASPPSQFELRVMSDSEPQPPAAAEPDHRLYLPVHQEWTVQVLTGADKQYCYQQAPGEDYFHMIVPGEIYVQSGDTKLCLNCALRRGAVTANRLFWQDRTA